MLEGESGLLNLFPDKDKPLYEPSKRRITFHNGAIATTYSAEEPERLRGPQNDTIWMDELAAWKYPQAAFDMAMFGLRLGSPRCIITTTPKPIQTVKELIQREDVCLTKGTTYDNKANLAPAFFKQIITKYEGTRLGRQELTAEILDDTPGALWKLNLIDKYRVSKAPTLKRIVVGIDPAVSTNSKSNETGIIIAGLGADGHGYVLGDLTVKGSPSEWASAAIAGYYDFEADKIIAESNNGGDMVAYTLSTIDKGVPIRLIHAARGKQTRAEPISALYEQGRVHHVGSLGKLEDQMTTWVPGEGESPDRVDALVWSLWELMIDGQKAYKKVKPSSMTGQSTWRV